MLDEKQLMELSEAYEHKAADAYARYMETGSPSTERTYEKHRDIAGAFLMAANAERDHRNLVWLKSEVRYLEGYADEEMRSQVERIIKYMDDNDI